MVLSGASSDRLACRQCKDLEIRCHAARLFFNLALYVSPLCSSPRVHDAGTSHAVRLLTRRTVAA